MQGLGLLITHQRGHSTVIKADKGRMVITPLAAFEDQFSVRRKLCQLL
jgi:hypothetical protein